MDKEIDIIFARIDKYARGGDFKSIDLILRGIPVELESTQLLISYLTITNTMKDKLQSRRSFFDKVFRKFCEEKMDHKRLYNLLSGLS